MSAPTVAQPGYEITEGISTYGAPTIRVFDTHADIHIAAAIQSAEGWILFAYRGASTNIPDSELPKCALTARTKEDAQAWLGFIAALYASAAANLAGAA